MSDYWKSTPKYWCKFCQTYVKDTKLEKQQHEATGRHQGNVKRHLRNLGKEHDREERDKQRAKDEVARLNGIVTGVAPPKKSFASSSASASAPRQATQEEKRKQMEQLAAMGVALPDQHRKEMAMVGEWQTMEERVIEDVKPGVQSFGVHGKRKRDGVEDSEEEEEEMPFSTQKKGWGSRYKSYGSAEDANIDFDALLAAGKSEIPKEETPIAEKEQPEDEKANVKHEANDDLPFTPTDQKDLLPVKKEEGEASSAPAGDPPVFFKKRKNKLAKT